MQPIIGTEEPKTQAAHGGRTRRADRERRLRQAIAARERLPHKKAANAQARVTQRAERFAYLRESHD